MIEMPIQQMNATVQAAFQDVLGPGMPVDVIIGNLNQDVPTATYFSDLVKSLRALDLSESGQITVFESLRKRERNNVNTTPIGQGTYGTIYRNQIGAAVYKKISFESGNPRELEENCREVFLESFIQTVLTCDPTYGKNIAKIIGIYREIPSKVAPGKTTLYIKMEVVSKSIDKLLQELSSGGKKPITYKQIKPVLQSLGTILTYFEKNYNFHHRDLHTGNVMFDGSNAIKLIDFGRSCLQLKQGKAAVTYSVVRDNVVIQPELGTRIAAQVRGSPCESYDLLIFMIALLEYDSDKFDGPAQAKLGELVTQSSGDNLFTIWNKRKPAKEATFWKMYPDVVAQWEGTTVKVRSANGLKDVTLSPSESPIRSPADFTAAVAAQAAGGRTRKSRRRQTRTRKNRY
jgi:serine/threonine protein kinase